jgi:hypothetical protein
MRYVRVSVYCGSEKTLTDLKDPNESMVLLQDKPHGYCIFLTQSHSVSLTRNRARVRGVCDLKFDVFRP